MSNLNAWLVVGALIFCLFAAGDSYAQQQDETTVAEETSVGILQAYLAAFNAQDLEAMMALVSPHVEWVNHMKGGRTAKADGQSALRQQMVDYFKAVPSVQMELEGLFTSGRIVSVRERAAWSVTQTDGTKEVDVKFSSVSISIFEMEDNLIRRVWHFPADQVVN